MLESVIAAVLRAGKLKVVTAAFAMIAMIAVADYAIGNRASLGLLYMLPMVVAATAFQPVFVVALALLCSALRSWFDTPAPQIEINLRFLFAFISYAGAGLFVIALIRNRATTLDHLGIIRREQEPGHEAERQLKVLVESSPAAIITIGENGEVLAANSAAASLVMLPPPESLPGRQISRYLPVLAAALQFDSGSEGLRAAAQCQGFRENGEIFLANLWFSSWDSPQGKRLAAIVVDSSEEMRDREAENLRQLLRANQIAAAAVSHEVRNLCSAISLVAGNIASKYAAAPDPDVQAMVSLVKGLEKLASHELQSRMSESFEDVEPRAVLDDLRIVIEPQWREAGGAVRWNLPASLPPVVAEHHALLQVCLNLAQNSLRATEQSRVAELAISASLEQGRMLLRFEDSGPGVADPGRLFAPFQPGANGAGLGLYVSRAILRSYGGDLKWEPRPAGSCFTIELELAHESVA
jgi:two-component system sensor kinase FixL